MRVAFVTATTLAVIFATAAAADGYPPRKPGLWELTVHNPATPDVTTKMCIDADVDQLFHQFSDNVRTRHCAKHDTKFAGDTVETDATCAMGSTTMTLNSVTKFTGDTVYHVDIKTHFDPPKLGHSDIDVSQDAKWVSECPADKKPGDFDMGHGIRLKIKTVARLGSLLQGHSAQ